MVFVEPGIPGATMAPGGRAWIDSGVVTKQWFNDGVYLSPFYPKDRPSFRKYPKSGWNGLEGRKEGRKGEGVMLRDGVNEV